MLDSLLFPLLDCRNLFCFFFLKVGEREIVVLDYRGRCWRLETETETESEREGCGCAMVSDMCMGGR